MTQSTVARHKFASVADVRRANSQAVLEAVWRPGAVTADDLMTATGLSRASVHDLCQRLIRAGWVHGARSHRPQAGAGRPARRYRLNEQAGLLVGVEAGVGTVRASVADLLGSVLGHDELDTEVSCDPAHRTAIVDRAVDLALKRAGAVPTEVLCLVIGVPAPVAPDGRNAYHGNPFWQAMNPDFVDVLAGRGRAVLVDNVVNLVASAEAARGRAQGVQDFVVLTMDEGFGAAVVMGGQLLRGAHGGVGEMRYLDHVHGVGGPTGAAALAVQLARSALEEAPAPSMLAGQDFDAHAVFAAAEQGDELAKGVVDDIGRRLTLVVATLATLLDPSLIVLSGHIARSCELVRRTVELDLPAYLQPPYPDVVLSELGGDAVIIGALQRGLEHVKNQALDYDATPG